MDKQQLDKNFFNEAVRKAHACGQYPQHYPGCRYKNSSIPLDECMCGCNERWWFELGREAERDAYYGSDPRRRA